ncbi:hypothetical protein [Empedobacter brevis]|uniref:hypothetical protein n=1 Tax=Empedobacter brevis TaxID=247 RepID=UPI0028B18F9A|nr:hypothetical protein [Empedobacter brevis]
MKLYFKTSNPNNLRKDIIDSIEDDERKTWSILESEGIKYLKHTQQWGEKGVIELTIDPHNNYLITEVLKFKNSNDEVKDFEGYYLGRFCELIFVNYANRFTSIEKK